MRNAECGMGEHGSCFTMAACRDSRNPQSAIRNPQSIRGITLVELLVTMAIMAIISAAIMGTARAALESARKTRTQSLVLKIGELVKERLASYETRRVDLNQGALSAVATVAASTPVDPANHGRALSDMRLLAKRELIKYEMPDRWSDVEEDFVFLSRPPALAQNYFRKLTQLRNNANNTPDKIATHQAAECLFLTVMHATGDGEARTMFAKQDIGDVDGDGAQEFIDGWGNPIAWVRWPAGFQERSQLLSADAQADHDPIDMYRRDQPNTVPAASLYPTTDLQKYVARLRDPWPAFRLVPLIYSSGPDGISDINTVGGASVSDPDTIAFDPYIIDTDLQSDDPDAFARNPYRVGAPRDDEINPDGEDNSIDNIHSHLTDY